MRSIMELWKPRLIIFQIFHWIPFYFTIFKTEKQWLFIMFFHKNHRRFGKSKDKYLNLEMTAINFYLFAIVYHRYIYKL